MNSISNKISKHSIKKKKKKKSKLSKKYKQFLNNDNIHLTQKKPINLEDIQIKVIKKDNRSMNQKINSKKDIHKKHMSKK